MGTSSTIAFSKSGYDPFIDFLKGFSILSVVLTHNLPMAVQDWTLFYAWGIQAVPIFLIIQVFHSYKKGLNAKPHYDLRKLLKKIILPFLMVQAIFAILLYSMGELDRGKIMTFMKLGGYGAGSYYVWVYIQFYLILPLFALIISRLVKNKMGGGKNCAAIHCHKLGVRDSQQLSGIAAPYLQAVVHTLPVPNISGLAMGRKWRAKQPSHIRVLCHEPSVDTLLPLCQPQP